jgi:hypothetical protein
MVQLLIKSRKFKKQKLRYQCPQEQAAASSPEQNEIDTLYTD